MQEFRNSHFIGIERVVDAGGDVGNLGEEHREQEHVGDIDLPDPAQDARTADQEARLQHRAAIHERRGVTGDENEDLGGVAEAVIADREPGQKIGRHVIDEDQPQRQTAEQIDP